MTTYNISLRVLVLLVVIGIGLFSSEILFAEISRPELLNLMSQKDQESNYAGYIVSFVATMPSTMPPLYDPNQGLVDIEHEFTYTGSAFAMKKTYNYEHPPVFASPASGYYQSLDYDKKGRLIVWRPMKMYILSNDERNDLFEERAVFLVDPNGLIERVACGPALQRYPVDMPYNMHQFQVFKNAMGLGFSRDLGTIKSANTLSTGQMEVVSRGSYGSALPGTWELTIDPDSGHIVRNAVFKTDFLNRPSLVVTTSGIISKDNIKLAKNGSFHHLGSHYKANIEVTGISKVVGSNPLYDEVVSQINSPLPPGAQIADCRTEETIITTIE
jgi:hypothetical protein